MIISTHRRILRCFNPEFKKRSDRYNDYIMTLREQRKQCQESKQNTLL